MFTPYLSPEKDNTKREVKKSPFSHFSDKR